MFYVAQGNPQAFGTACVLTNFLTLVKIQVKKVREFFPLDLIGMEEREEAKNKKILPQTLSDL